MNSPFSPCRTPFEQWFAHKPIHGDELAVSMIHCTLVVPFYAVACHTDPTCVGLQGHNVALKEQARTSAGS